MRDRVPDGTDKITRTGEKNDEAQSPVSAANDYWRLKLLGMTIYRTLSKGGVPRRQSERKTNRFGNSKGRQRSKKCPSPACVALSRFGNREDETA